MPSLSKNHIFIIIHIIFLITIPTKVNTDENIFPEVQTYGDINLFVNLDDGTTNNVVNSVSTHVQKFYNSMFTSIYKLEKASYQTYKDLFNATTSQKVKITLSSEQYDLNIDKLTFARFHDEKIDIINPKISVKINDAVYPKNYISDQKSDSVIKFSYYSGNINSGLITYYNNLIIKCQKVTKSYFFNFCLNNEGKLVILNFINYYVNDVTSKVQLSVEIPSTYKDIFVTSSIQKNINETESSMLFLVDSDKNIYYFSIAENTCSSTNDIPILKYVNKTNINSNIIQIGYDDNYIYVATDNSIIRYLRTSENKEKELSIEVKDFIILEKKIWIINSDGLNIVDKSNLTKDKTYSHPNMLKFDFFFNGIDNKDSTRYIGILINQDLSNNIPEVIIELISNSQYESTPLLNKIYYNSKKNYKTSNFPILNITASDIQSYCTYLLDLEEYKIIIIPRTVAFFQKCLIYKINDITLRMTPSIKTLKLNIFNAGQFRIINDEDNYYPYLNIIINENANYLFIHDEPSSPDIKIQFSNEARYRIFSYQHQDCSYYDSNKNFVLKECDYVTAFKLQIYLKKNTIFFWIFTIVAFIDAIIFVIFLIWCMFRKDYEKIKRRTESGIGEIKNARSVDQESARSEKDKVEEKNKK